MTDEHWWEWPHWKTKAPPDYVLPKGHKYEPPQYQNIPNPALIPNAALTLEIMQHMWPHGDQHCPGLLKGIADASAAVFAKYEIKTRMAIAHMMGQFSEECGAGLELTENLNYTAESLVRVWPRHFTGSMAERYAHNPRAIGNIAYGGRMGNAPPPSDDGYNFRGKGLSQLTGKDNYQKLKEVTGLDVIAHPDLLIDPAHALECGVADYVKLCGCLPFAEKDDTIEETKHLNGGLIGLPVRQAWIKKWKTALAV